MAEKAARKQEKLAFSLAAVCGAAWIAILLFGKPTRGRDWRANEGTVRLSPTVVYRIALLSPYRTDTPPDVPDASTPAGQSTYRELLESGGARNLSFRSGDTGMVAEFDQSWGEPRTLTFGKPALGTFSPLSARRLDGLEWDSP